MKLLRVEDIEKRLNVSKWSVRRYLRQGMFNPQKIGRRWYVTKESLDKFWGRE